MARYIDADALLKYKAQLYDENGVGFYAVGTGDILRMPTADVRENKHGEWIPMGDVDQDNNQLFMCSNCCSADLHAVKVEVPFCWKCGAKMRGGTQ